MERIEKQTKTGEGNTALHPQSRLFAGYVKVSVVLHGLYVISRSAQNGYKSLRFINHQVCIEHQSE